MKHSDDEASVQQKRISLFMAVCDREETFNGQDVSRYLHLLTNTYAPIFRVYLPKRFDKAEARNLHLHLADAA